jgi:hypothetical protein
MASNGSNSYGTPTQLSSTAFYGSVATLSGDVTGAGEPDLVAVDGSGTWVMTSNGSTFGAPTQWSSVPFYGTRATLLADLTGNGKDDLVAVNSNSVWVMLSTGTGFSAPVLWSTATFYGSVTNLAADVNGDGNADLIAVNGNSTWVMLSTGTGFGAPTEWSSEAFYGSHATLAADVNDDGYADLIAVNGNSTWVMTSNGSTFGAPTLWSSAAFYGSVATFAGDVNGDGKADLIAVNGNSTWVMLSNGASAFGTPSEWSSQAFYGSVATLLATETATVPAMVSAVVTSSSIAITYNENVTCPATGADTDFTYDSAASTSGGAISGCTPSGAVLTLTAGTTFTLPTGSGSIVYTAPTTSTNSNAVAAASFAADFAATQTLDIGAAPAMVSASVTSSTIAITYNEPVSCPPTGADTDFTYDYTTSTTGGAVSGCSTSGDVLTLTTASTFTLPTGSTGSIVYTAPGSSTTSDAVYATGTTTNFAATQTLGVSAVPAMLSATVSSSSIVVTYNEAVSCPATGADTNFTYDTTGTTSGGAVGGCTTSGTALTLTPSTTFTTPATGASTLIYTVPTTNSSSTAVYATAAPSDYAAAQTLNLGPVPTMESASVTTSSIVITYNESVTCKAGDSAYSDFSYYDGSGNGGGIASCVFSSDTLTLSPSTTFIVPTGSSATITYTAPTPSTIANAVYATGTTTNFAATQILASAGTPSMVSTAWTGSSSIQVTYNEPVSCNATGADGDFTYDSSTGVSGGAVTGCTASGDVLTLVDSGTFSTPTNSGSLSYTAPGSPSTTTAVYETGSTSNFAATQSGVAVRPVPVMISAVVDTSAGTIAITYNISVSCDPAGSAWSQFTYDSATSTSGGTVTGCSHTNETVTLTLTSLLPPGAGAAITYTAPGSPTETTAVYATAIPTDYASTWLLMSTGITGS